MPSTPVAQCPFYLTFCMSSWMTWAGKTEYPFYRLCMQGPGWFIMMSSHDLEGGDEVGATCLWPQLQLLGVAVLVILGCLTQHPGLSHLLQGCRKDTVVPNCQAATGDVFLNSAAWFSTARQQPVMCSWTLLLQCWSLDPHFFSRGIHFFQWANLVLFWELSYILNSPRIL